MKLIFDRVVSFVAIIMLSPILIIITLLVKIDSRGPIVFRQKRVGIRNSEFTMYKFRTMRVGTPNVATDKLGDSSQYMTKVGYFLRKYSLDELPQLFNILLGQMSFVGPRPALYNQYDLRQMRNERGISGLRPGLTGWAQVNGRDDIELEQKVNLDEYYLKHRSFGLDFRILLLTFGCVFIGNGERSELVKVKEHDI